MQRRLGQKRAEMQEEIGQRQPEQLLLGSLAIGLGSSFGTTEDPPGTGEEAQVQPRRYGQIDRPADRRQPERKRGRDQQQGIAEDMVARDAPAMRLGQHRDAGAAVVRLDEERQRPEMRRRPHEDQREHQKAFKRDAARRHRPADHRREGPGGAADHDVLRRRALQPDRVDHHVEEDGEGQQRRGDAIRHHRQKPDRQPRKRQPDRQRLARGHPPRRDRPAGGALHLGVDVGIPPHVQRARGATAHRDAGNRHRAAQRIKVARRDQHADERGEDHKRHHPRLQQHDVIARAGRARRPLGAGRIGDLLRPHVHLPLLVPQRTGVGA
ncbi:hypothetical protein SDC9_37645 [bioreactor metagenome]|uniref:Uncharacterized protein n=1 Tax=bioreactor metagenome TaxID=1076179 RepID=A0A644VK36_9ZZZZ